MVQLLWFHLLVLGNVSFLAFTGISAQPRDGRVQTKNLMFIVDSSRSICDGDMDLSLACDNFKLTIDFISSVAGHFDTVSSRQARSSSQPTRIGLVILTTATYAVLNLTEYTDDQTLRTAISNLTYRKGGTMDMTDALRLMRTQVFGLRKALPNAERILTIITDGATPLDLTTLQSEINAVIGSGIRMIAVGVTSPANRDAVRRLSSPPQVEGVNYFLNPDYATLEQNLGSKVRAVVWGD